MLEADRIANNKNKLLELYPPYRPLIDGVMKDMELVGYRPRLQ